MDIFANYYLAAFFLGALHAIEVDHMVAVTAFAGGKPRITAAVRYGASWGLGHAAIVIVAGGILTAFKFSVPEQWVEALEGLVGLSLIALGIWAVLRARRFHIHSPEKHAEQNHLDHGHLHAHPGAKAHGHTHTDSQQDSHHRHLPTLMGALHGLAGTAPLVAIIPIALLSDVKTTFIYLLIFSVATTLSMMAYAGLAAVAITGAANTQKKIRWISYVIAFATIGVGCWWILRAYV